VEVSDDFSFDFKSLMILAVIYRISANTVAGKLIMSHTEGESYFFTFGKSEVVKPLHNLFFFIMI